MRKDEFIKELSKRLYGLKDADRNDIINYYQELIEDKVENENLTEEDVIEELGSLDDIAKKVNPNFQFNDKIKYNEEPVRREYKSDDKVYDLLVKIIYVIVMFGIVIGAISVFSVLFSLVGIAVYLLVYSVFVMTHSLYSGMFLLGLAIILSGISIIAIPVTVKLVKLAKNWVKKVVFWKNERLT